MGTAHAWRPEVIKSLMAYKKSLDEGAAKAHLRGTKLKNSTNPDEFRMREYSHRAVVLTHISIAIAEYIARHVAPKPNAATGGRTNGHES